MRALGLLLLFFSLFIFSFGQISDSELKKDMQFVDKVEKRLKVIDRELQEKGFNTELVDELNSYGYPMNMLKNKYLDYNEERYGKLYRFYKRVDRVYNEVLYVKRGVFPAILMDEVKEIRSPVCNIRAEGNRRETLTIVIEDPNNEKAVLELLTKTQLQYVHLIGVKTLNFEKCP